MAQHRERVNLHLDIDRFTGRMALAKRAAEVMVAEMALDHATWEPIDWDRLA